jgi:septum site-determining protein MinC
MIAIKGLRQGILIVFDTTGNTPWLSQLFELERKLEANTNFFKGGRIALDVKSFALDADDIARAKNLLTRYDVALWAIVSANANTNAQVRAAGLQDTLSEPTPTPATAPAPEPAPAPARTPKPEAAPAPTQDREGQATPKPNVGRAQGVLDEAETQAPFGAETADTYSIEGSDGLLVRRRVRSGQVLRHPGHIVVLGDVNPGAQLIAGGDIVVWGKLQGAVHAGALGDDTAVVCALDMAPALLKIADAARMPRVDKRRKPTRPEQAALKDQQIMLTEWKT